MKRFYIIISTAFLICLSGCLTVSDNSNRLNDQLIKAIKSNNLELTHTLIYEGADINYTNDNGWTPLMLSIKFEHDEITNYLLSQNPVVDTVSLNYKSPLLLSLENKNYDIATKVASHNPRIHLKDKYLKFLPELLLGKHNTIINLFIIREIDLDYTFKTGWTTLIYATIHKNPNLALYLIKEGANLNVSTQKGLTPLILSIKNGLPEVAIELINNGAHFNKEDLNGWSPIMYSTYYNYLDITEVLIEKEVDLDIEAEDGCYPLYYAINNDNYELVVALVEAGADITKKKSPIIRALYKGNKRIIDYLLKQNERFNTNSKNATAWYISTADNNDFDLDLALKLALEACEETNYTDSHILDTLAAVYASLNKWEEAISFQEKAIEAFKNEPAESHHEQCSENMFSRLSLYHNKERYISKF